MRTIETKVYQFAELSKKAKETAIEELRSINTDFGDWHNSAIEDWQEKLEALGYEDPKILYSGFWSQGDGACFTATIDIEKYIKVHKLSRKLSKLLKYQRETGNVIGKIEHSWRYFFAKSTDVVLYGYGDEVIDDQLEELEEFITKEREELGDQLYKELECEYYALETDESVIDTIESNEYEFLADGSRN